ncbi:MAG: hypothetical protein ACT4OJ_10920 [Bacteroidota bacterium]
MVIAEKSMVSPDVLKNNMLSIHSFLRESYKTARRQWDNGVSFFKDEFSTVRSKAGEYLHRMILPVNNFLKDISEIETELFEEVQKSSGIVPAEVAAAISAGEENY